MDTSEFHNLAVAEVQSVYRLAYHLLPGSQEVDDLVQETYLHAFKASGSFQLTERGIRPWLYKILHNLIRKELGDQVRQPTSLEGTDTPDRVPRSEALNASAIDWDAIDERLKAAIRELPLAYRTVFLLCAVEGLKYREIADVISMPVGTVMSRLHRARVILARQLMDLAAEQRLVQAK